MSKTRRTLSVIGCAGILLAGCGGGNDSDDGGAGGSQAQMMLEEVSSGFGQLLPHTIRKLQSGVPSTETVSIRSAQDLFDNLIPGNPILPVPRFAESALLPSGAEGNHFLYARFTREIDIASVLDSSPAGGNSGMTGVVNVVATDPISGDSLPIVGRAFVGGQTFAGELVGNPPLFPLQRWVALDSSGNTMVLRAEGLGFPGTQGSFNGSHLLVSDKTLLFVPDADGDLSTFETFPTGVQIRMQISTALRATNGEFLQGRALASSTVGPDVLSPEVVRSPPPLNQPLITPGNGEVDVDPMTTIRVSFTEPVQPLSVGNLSDGTPPGLSSLIKIEFGPANSRTDMPFAVMPASVFDLATYELTPAFNFPGSGPPFAQCGTFSLVDITINPGQLQDLAQNEDPADPSQTVPNTNLLGALTFFDTGEGPGIVNAPVAPDVIYALRSGALPGVSVVDLNGYGAGTGNPTFDQSNPQFEHTNFPNDPNVIFHTSLRPSLSIGTCTINGGSAGVYTLTRDSSLSDLVLRPPLLSNVADLMIGHALDGTFNNAQFPFGCQAGGGEVCTLDGLKVINAVPNGNTMSPLQPGQIPGNFTPGAPNIISWSPHPNPPPLSFPPLCIAPFMGAQEPSSIDNTTPPPGFPVVPNLLGPGDPFGNPLASPPIPPSGLLTPEQNVYFQGPTQGQTNITACTPYEIRQQVGHFLYVVDRQRREVVVLNSNRMTVVDRIAVPDPTTVAMGTNLDFLAIASQQADTVTFIDINPTSSTFHQTVKTTVVGDAPRGLAWQPDNEDILVCNEGDNSLSIISAFSLEVRKVVSAQLNDPFEVVCLPRMLGYSFNRGVYFAYILNRVGTLALFESGPNGVNGWGFDDVIGIAPFEFQNPKTMHPDPNSLQASIWIAHEGPIDPLNGNPGPVGEGAISQLLIQSAQPGQLPLSGSTSPQFRSMQLAVPVSVGEDQLLGVPVDIALDNLRSWGGFINPQNPFSAGGAFGGLPLNGKNLIRPNGGTFRNTVTSAFLFAAVPNPQGSAGVVDVLQVDSGGALRRDVNPYEPGIQSIRVPNVIGVSDYWRQ